MNDIYNAVTVHLRPSDITKAIDGLEKWRKEYEKPETTPSDPEVDVEVVETVKISYFTRGVDKAIIDQLDEALNEAGVTEHSLDWETADVDEAHQAVDELKDTINKGLMAGGFRDAKHKVTDKCSVEQMAAICDAERELTIAMNCARFDQWDQFQGALTVVEHLMAKAFPTQFSNLVKPMANEERAA